MFFHEMVTVPVLVPVEELPVPVPVEWDALEVESVGLSVEELLVSVLNGLVRDDFNRRSASVVDTSTLLRALLPLPLPFPLPLPVNERLMGGMLDAL